MKKFLVLMIVILMVLTLCACDSEAVAAAKKAYEEANYEEVVKALAEEDITDVKVANILFISQVYVAYDKGEYQTVVEMLSNKEAEYSELNELLLISKANIAFSENQYYEAISLLQNTLNYNEKELYNKALDAAIKDALGSYDARSLLETYDLDVSVDELVYQGIADACTNFDYEAFCCMEELIEILPEGNLKENLSIYSAGNQKNKVKAFMRGDWKIVYDEDGQDAAIVSVRVHEDDEKCVGFLTQVSKFMEQYYYEVNDVYWQDFVFEKNLPISVYNTVRYDTGVISGEVSSVELDMENAKMYIHVTGTVNPDRVYHKVA